MAAVVPKTIKQDTYEKVKELIEKHPDTPVSALCKKHKLSALYYYKVRKELEGSKKPAPKYKKLKVTESSPPSGGKLVMVMGSPDQIREFIGGM